MKRVINVIIKGTPAVKRKTRGDKDACRRWTEAVKLATKDFPKVTDKCKMEVKFVFSRDQYPEDYPFGPDIDNHLKSFQDALNETIFLKAPGKDSVIVEVVARKFEENKKQVPGATLKIWQ